MCATVAVRDQLPSVAVVEAVASREGIDPTEFDVPLFDAINPEALDKLVGGAPERQNPLQIEFTYYGYDVVVTSDGSVRVSDGTRALS